MFGVRVVSYGGGGLDSAPWRRFRYKGGSEMEAKGEYFFKPENLEQHAVLSVAILQACRRGG